MEDRQSSSVKDMTTLVFEHIFVGGNRYHGAVVVSMKIAHQKGYNGCSCL
jgi:hypothetical protein